MSDQEYVDARLIAAELRVARYPHKCACGKVIRPGERYRHEFALVDGDPMVVRTGDHIHLFEEEEARLAAEEDANWSKP